MRVRRVGGVGGAVVRHATFADVARGRRFCFWLDETCLVEGQGYRASLVVEGVSGHFPVGDWPYTGAPGESCPYFFGPSIADALRAVDVCNERLGYDREAALRIVCSSFGSGARS